MTLATPTIVKFWIKHVIHLKKDEVKIKLLFFSQTLTSVATASAIALMPFFLFIYSNAILDEEKCLKEYNGPCPEIPYFPIMRTLSILIASLIVGILVKWRFKRNKIIKKISKLGTILGFLVIMTFIVLALLIYEEAWLVSRNMWISAIFIPMLGKILKNPTDQN